MNEHIIRYISYLKQETEDFADLLIMYDTATNKSEFELSVPIYYFNSSNFQNFFHLGFSRLPNPLLVLIKFALCNSYSHYLFLENDIVLYGRFKDFLAKLVKDKTIDYIHISADESGSATAHWPYLLINNNPFNKIYFAWSQMFYVSHNYVLDIERFIRSNDSFYYEFLLPTLAYNGKYRIKQFEDLGYAFFVSWGPADVYETKFLNNKLPDTFYHPIKKLELVDWSIVSRIKANPDA